MKTTTDSSNALFSSTKKLASKSQAIQRVFVEEGLRRVLKDTEAKTQPAFKLKDASARGGDMLISNTREWQELEDEHLAANLR